MKAIMSGDIQIDSEIEIKYITALKIIIEAQRHGICRLRGVLKNEVVIQEILSLERDIYVSITNKVDGEILYRGIVKEAKVYFENEFYSIDMTIVTASKKLDREKRQKSFQDIVMSYKRAVKRVIEPYKNAYAIFAEEADVELGAPVIQYAETDWEFLMRLGSQLNLPLYADYLTGSTGLYFGMRKGRSISIEETAYHCGISSKQYEMNISQKNMTKSDYLYYVIASEENYQIGDIFNLKTGSYVVFKKEVELICERIEYTYWVGKRGNWYIPRIEHKQLTGMEFIGTVVNVKPDKVNISLKIDEPYKGAEYWWDWMPVSGNIMYAMPERGTTIKLCFGSGEAIEGVVMVNSRSNGKDMPEQQERMFRTRADKRMELYPRQLSFQGGGGKTTILDDKSICFESIGMIEMTALGEISFNASKINAQTPLEINMYKA